MQGRADMVEKDNPKSILERRRHAPPHVLIAAKSVGEHHPRGTGAGGTNVVAKELTHYFPKPPPRHTGTISHSAVGVMSQFRATSDKFTPCPTANSIRLALQRESDDASSDGRLAQTDLVGDHRAISIKSFA